MEKKQADMPNLDAVIKQIDSLEIELKAYMQIRKGMNGEWDRKCETMMDKLTILGSWVHDYMHNCVALPDADNPVYKRSMLCRVRRALKYSF